MSDFSLPTIADTWANIIAFLKNRDVDLAKWLDPAKTTVSNPLADFIRWNSANHYLEIYNGSTWGPLDSSYDINVTKLGGAVAAAYALLASPAFTGTPTAPTPGGGDNSTKIATTAFIVALLASYATLASPALTGNPTAPTAAADDNDTSIATTAYVIGQNYLKKVAVAATGTNNYTATPSPALAGYTANHVYIISFANANTSTAPDLAISALSAKVIKKMGGVALSPGDIQANHAAILLDDGTNFILLNPAKGVLRGKQTVWIPAGAMISRTTAGAASATAELATNKIMLKTLDFDQSTQQHAQFQIKMPKGWDEGTVSARFVWTFPSGTGNVIWGLQGVAHSDGDALDVAFGAAQEVTDTALTVNQEHLSPETAQITIGGTPVENDLVTYQVYRKAADGADTLNANGQLLGLELIVNFNAADDA